MPSHANDSRHDRRSIAQGAATLAAAFVVGFAVTAILGDSRTEASDGTQRSSVDPGAYSPSLPDESLDPAGVVRAQMAALSTCGIDDHAIERVFSFASPENRVVTGPLERFEQMVWSEPYVNLIENRGWTIGRSVERDQAAAVLVTVVDRRGESRLFRFYLSRQTGRYDGRWMTDAVFAMNAEQASDEVRRNSQI